MTKAHLEDSAPDREPLNIAGLDADLLQVQHQLPVLVLGLYRLTLQMRIAEIKLSRKTSEWFVTIPSQIYQI